MKEEVGEKCFIICCVRFECITIDCIAKAKLFWTEILGGTPQSLPLRHGSLSLPEPGIRNTMVSMVPSA